MHDADWYGRVMTEEGSPAMIPLEESPWLPMYTELARLIEPHEPVVDLGAGTGRFAQLLLEREHYASIELVDWSAEVLGQAWLAVDGMDNENVHMTVADLVEEWAPHDERAGGTVYTCMEVLEHLEGDADVQLVAKIPNGHRFLFSVPSYWSESHARTFQHPEAIFIRYGQLLQITRWALVPVHEPIKHVHVVEGRRRADSWR